MNDSLKMRNQRGSHFIAPLAFLQVVLVALLAFAAGGGGVYNLSVTDSATHVKYPVFSTTNGNYVTNYLCITPSMTNSLNFTIAPTNFLYNISWNFGGEATPNTATGTNALVTLNMPLPTYTVPVTISSSRTNTDSGGSPICTTTNHTLVVLVPNYITRDGNMVNSTNNTVCVGQQINLTNYLATNIPSSAITSYQWTIPGNTFKNYATNSLGQFTGVLSNLQTNDLAQPGVSFYWADGPTNRVVTCSAVIYGQTNTISATLTVLRPTASIDSSLCNATAAVDDSWAGMPMNPSYIQAVHFGDGLNTLMAFKANITPPTGFSTGHYVWIQIINSISANVVGGGQTYTLGPATNLLDDPAPYFGIIDGPIDDFPGQPLKAGQSGGFTADNFTTYLMWKPSTPNAQYVPVRKIAWGWTGYGTYVGGTTWTASNLSGPGTLSDADATNHPTWTQTFHQLQWSPSDPDP